MSQDLAALALTLASYALTWIVQSSVLLGLGLTIGRLIRRNGPAIQSGVYRTTLAAVLVCPIAAALLSAAGVDGLMLRIPSREVVSVTPAQEVDTPVTNVEPAGTSPQVALASEHVAVEPPPPSRGQAEHAAAVSRSIPSDAPVAPVYRTGLPFAAAVSIAVRVAGRIGVPWGQTGPRSATDEPPSRPGPRRRRRCQGAL